LFRGSFFERRPAIPVTIRAPAKDNGHPFLPEGAFAGEIGPFSGPEAGVTFECRLDAAAFATCTSPQTYTTLAQGPHTFEVRARDAAGNVDATPATRTFTVDTVAPDTTIDSGPSAPSTRNSATFVFSTAEAGSRFECSVDGGPFGPCSPPFTRGELPP